MKEDDGAIYVPPKDGLPYLVVTVSGGDVSAQPVSTRAEARALLSRVRLQQVRARERGRDSLERTIQQA
jgi:hypothetical protein